MNLVRGARAGLASGVTVAFIYLFIKIIMLLLSESGNILIFLIFVGLGILIWGGLEGYYGQAIKEEISKMPLARKVDRIFLDLEFTFTIVFVILILIVSIVLGIFFEALYKNLPTKTSTKRSLVYLGTIWFLLGVIAFYISQGEGNFRFHIINILGWLLYGFLLGKFYDAFSKEPDAGIIRMIKKVILRR